MPEEGSRFIAEVIDQTPIISVITEIEALSWKSKDRSKEEIVKAFITDSTVLPLVASVVAQCIIIRRGIKIKTPDSIIAATAIVHNLTLLSSDDGFRNINGLKVIDPKYL